MIAANDIDNCFQLYEVLRVALMFVFLQNYIVLSNLKC